MAQLRSTPSGSSERSRLDEFVGREGDTSRLIQRVGQGQMTWLCGPPGVGKTRLAYEVVRHTEGPVCFVDAHGVTSEAELLDALARALGLAQLQSIQELGRLTSKRPLGCVVLDNVDDVVDPAWEVAEELSRLDIGVICTARIQQPGATELGGLEPEQARRLLEVRAGRALDPDGARELIDLLEGLPLAIELAARQLDIMSAATFADRLASGAAAAMLQAAIRESWDRLTTGEREALVAAAVFRFEFDLTALEAVVGRSCDHALRTLVRHSLVSRADAHDGQIRFRVLDAVRTFVLDEWDATTAEIRHANYHAELGLDAWKEQHSHDVARHVDTLTFAAREFEVATDYAAQHELADAAAGLVLGLCLLNYYLDTRHRTFDRVPPVRRLISGAERAFWVWYELAHARIDMNQPAEATEFIDEMERLAGSVLERAILSRTLSRQAHHLGDVARGLKLADAALDLARESGDALEQISSQINWAGVAYPIPEHHSDALATLQRAARSAAKLGVLHDEAMCYYMTAYALAESVQVSAERDAIEKALALFEQAHNWGLVLECRWMLGMLEGTQGRSELSRELLMQVHDDAVTAGMFSLARTSAEILFSVEIDAGEIERAETAIELQEELLALEPDDFAHHWIGVQKGRLLAHRGELDDAASALQLALATEGPHWNPALKMWPRGVLLVVLARLGRDDDVAKLGEEVRAADFDNPSWQAFTSFALAAAEHFASGDELQFAAICAELGQTREFECSAEVRSLVRLAGGLQWATAAESEAIEDALLVAHDGSRFRLPDTAEWVDISTRKTLASLLLRVVEAAEAKQGPIDADELIAAIWRDETLTHESGMNRLRASVSMLRKAGLGKLLVFENGGYRIAEDVDVVRL